MDGDGGDNDRLVQMASPVLQWGAVKKKQNAECAEYAASSSRAPVGGPGAERQLHILLDSPKECAQQCAKGPRNIRAFKQARSLSEP